jgi:hypothetical protein
MLYSRVRGKITTVVCGQFISVSCRRGSGERLRKAPVVWAEALLDGGRSEQPVVRKRGSAHSRHDGLLLYMVEALDQTPPNIPCS